MPELLVSVLEAARRLGIGRTNVFRCLNEGKIRAVRLGGRTLVPVAELARFVDALPERGKHADERAVHGHTDENARP